MPSVMHKKTTTPKARRPAAAAAPGRCPARAVPAATGGVALADPVPAGFSGGSRTATAVLNS